MKVTTYIINKGTEYMNTKNEAARAEKETIFELTKKLNTVSADLEHFCEDVIRVRAIFKAVRYAIAEGVADKDDCMDGCCMILDNLLDRVEESYSMSDEFVREAVPLNE